MCILFPGDKCKPTEYAQVKNMLLDLQSRRYITPSEDEIVDEKMALKKLLVDQMFHSFDSDNNGLVDTNELSQVRFVSSSTVAIQLSLSGLTHMEYYVLECFHF